MSAEVTTRPTPHRLGSLFEILEEMGEDPRFTFKLARVGQDAPLAAVDVHHKESDGYGGLVRFLRQQGIDFTSPLARQEVAPPGWLDRLRALGRVVRHPAGEPLVLRHRNPDWPRGTPVSAQACAARLLSLEETAQVLAAAKAAGASMSSYLLHALTEAVLPQVVEPSRSITWGVPVNMRGPIQIEPDDANCSSIVPITFPRGCPPAEIHRALQDALAANLHWGKWDQLNTAARLGKRILRKKVTHYYRNADPARIGMFSNLGVWRGGTDADVGILAYNMPLLSEPLSVGAVTWNGKLALSLRAHPSLTLDTPEVRRWMDAWLTQLGGAR